MYEAGEKRCGPPEPEAPAEVSAHIVQRHIGYSTTRIKKEIGLMCNMFGRNRCRCCFCCRCCCGGNGGIGNGGWPGCGNDHGNGSDCGCGNQNGNNSGGTGGCGTTQGCCCCAGAYRTGYRNGYYQGWNDAVSQSAGSGSCGSCGSACTGSGGCGCAITSLEGEA